MSDTATGVVLILGSAPDAVRCQGWSKALFPTIVAINNAWRLRDDWDYLVTPDDFPDARLPPKPRFGQSLVRAAEYVPANNRFGGVFYAGGTMAFSTGYWALHALRPRVLAFLGCDMVYPRAGQTHFYGQGASDPLRNDPSLRSLEAKSARLMLMAAQQQCACVRLSTGPSRLVFPSVALGEAAGAQPTRGAADNAVVTLAEAEERRLDYRFPSGRYWEHDQPFALDEIDALDRLWLKAAKTAAIGALAK